MTTDTQTIEELATQQSYKWGFVTDIEADAAPPRPKDGPTLRSSRYSIEAGSAPARNTSARSSAVSIVY